MRRISLWRGLRLAWLGPGLLAGTVGTAQEAAPRLVAPQGFEITVYAEGLDRPWGHAFGPDGRLYVAEMGAGRVVRLTDRDGDGRVDSVATIVAGLDRPSGLVWQGADVLIAEADRVTRLANAASVVGQPTVVLDGLPADSPASRSLIAAPTGSAFFVAIGASCDICQETDGRRATILRVVQAGQREEVWARGLHHTGGLAHHPDTGELWATCAGRGDLGAELPPDELNVIRRGAHYGWPYCYGARIPSPEYADRTRCDTTEPPVLIFPAHSTPLGLAFYTAQAFPAVYRGDAFVALHGSGSGATLAGYKVVRVRVHGGRPQAREDFVTGWVGRGGQVLGRPVQPLVGPDGALYVSDDHGGRIWRVRYAGDRPAAAPGG